jgi:hypothetical protein
MCIFWQRINLLAFTVFACDLSFSPSLSQLSKLHLWRPQLDGESGGGPGIARITHVFPCQNYSISAPYSILIFRSSPTNAM